MCVEFRLEQLRFLADLMRSKWLCVSGPALWWNLSEAAGSWLFLTLHAAGVPWSERDFVILYSSCRPQYWKNPHIQSYINVNWFTHFPADSSLRILCSFAVVTLHLRPATTVCVHAPHVVTILLTAERRLKNPGEQDEIDYGYSKFQFKTLLRANPQNCLQG